MKQLIFAAILVLISFGIQAQTPYNDKVQFNLGDTTDEAGTVYKRKGQFEAIIYNQRIKSIAIQVRVKFLNKDVEMERWMKPYTKEFTINNETFVVLATGVKVGDRTAMRKLYGVLDQADTTNQTYLTSVFGGDSLTVACSGHYDYIVRMFDVNNRLHNIIKALAQQANVEGKLD